MEEKMGRRERKKLLSRKAILDAAVREFSRKGFKETSVADIMNAADLGIGTFYNYFESKEEILMCLLGRLVDEVDEALAGMRAAKRPSYELLEAGSRITARFLDENRFLLPLFLAAAEHSAKPQAKMPKGMVTPGFKPIFEDILREGQLAGEIRDDVSAELIARSIRRRRSASSPLVFRRMWHSRRACCSRGYASSDDMPHGEMKLFIGF